MQRREFLTASAVAMGSVLLDGKRGSAGESADGQTPGAQGRIYASPAEAIRSPREELAYVVALYSGTKTPQPDFLATIDLDNQFCIQADEVDYEAIDRNLTFELQS